jgi:putative ATP-dependent endonuclease of the OLD family
MGRIKVRRENPAVSTQQIEPLALYLLDAKRDIADDLRTKSSFWSKMVSEHGLTAEDVTRIEDELSDINRDIVSSSGVFSHIETHLKDFHVTLACDEESIAIAPLARHLRDLSRGMDVVLSMRGAPRFLYSSKAWGPGASALFLHSGPLQHGDRNKQTLERFIR